MALSNRSADTTDAGNHVETVVEFLKKSESESEFNRVLRKDLENAKEVHRAFFPRKTPSIPGLACETFYRPARDIGGDYYDFLPLQADHWGIAIGDVCGKGIGAALLMASLQASLLRSHSIMITSSNSSMKRSRMPTQFLGVRLHTMAISGLSCVRTELDPLLIIPFLAHHPVQLDRQPARHSNLGDLSASPHHQVKVSAAPFRKTANRRLRRLHQSTLKD